MVASKFVRITELLCSMAGGCLDDGDPFGWGWQKLWFWGKTHSKAQVQTSTMAWLWEIVKVRRFLER